MYSDVTSGPCDRSVLGLWELGKQTLLPSSDTMEATSEATSEATASLSLYVVEMVQVIFCISVISQGQGNCLRHQLRVITIAQGL